MDKEDARRQSLGELHERRKQVIRLYKKGYKIMRIVALTGLSWPTVRTAIRAELELARMWRCGESLTAESRVDSSCEWIARRLIRLIRKRLSASFCRRRKRSNA
jgi:hypothetical protein